VGRLRVGVIGIGFGQQVHVPAFRADRRCEVVALCASSQDRAAAISSRLNIGQSYGDWRRMIRSEEIDAVSIAVPPVIQSEIAIAALEMGKHVFAEKPLASTKAAAVYMTEAAARAARANVIDFEFCEIDEWQKARDILSSGGIGRLRHAAVSWNVETYANKLGLENWKTDVERGGGALNSLASHALFYLDWLVGPVSGVLTRTFRAPDDRRPADSLAVMCLELDAGAAASLSISTHAFLGTGHRVELYGDAGAIVLENSASDYAAGFRLLMGTRESNRLEEVTVNRSWEGCADGRVAPVARLIRRFVDWAIDGRPASPDFKTGLRVQCLLDAARKSSETGCVVRKPF
jgi:predicted dehydrogenase